MEMEPPNFTSTFLYSLLVLAYNSKPIPVAAVALDFIYGGNTDRANFSGGNTDRANIICLKLMLSSQFNIIWVTGTINSQLSIPDTEQQSMQNTDKKYL
jgi:hypothetical protein